MTATKAPRLPESDERAAADQPTRGLMSFKAFLRLNGGFGVAKANERKTD
jgi:hypothetical protein